MVDTPHPIRTAKLSTIGPDQYCGGGPRGNLGCRMFFSSFAQIFFVWPNFFFIEPIFFLLNNFFFIHQFFRFLHGIHHKNIVPIIRSYHGGYTASHPNCEVKHHWARSVLRWGTTRESRVSNVFFFWIEQFFFYWKIFFVGPIFFVEQIFFWLLDKFFFYSPIFSFSARHTSQKHRSHHSITPWWIHRIPSELRS